MAAITVNGVTLAHGDDLVLDHVDLDVPDGELLGIVGPSGSGKTALVRIITGLERPTAGRVLIDGLPPHRMRRRDPGITLVAQQAALAAATGRAYIEMTTHRSRPDHLAEQMAATSTHLRLGHLLDTPTRNLSAGEAQVVRVARAFLARPGLLVLDEPLAHLDHPLRLALRADLAALHREHRVTTVLATGDHADAMALADRIAVISGGRVHQVGTGRELLDRPIDLDVAGLIGDPQMNLIDAVVAGEPGELWFDVASCRVRAWSPVFEPYRGLPVVLGIRADDVTAASGGRGLDALEGRVRVSVPAGDRSLAWVAVEGAGELAVREPSARPPGTTLRLRLPADRLHVFDPLTGRALHHPVR
ncbi:MAG: ABC transporter ATP-binding protein [Actinomycetota bacterium]|nr:ABC transporter ATP-binding protein [Actinomycetota bacterium]